MKDFIQGDPSKVWNDLKKLTESFSSSSTINSSSSDVVKDQNGKLLYDFFRYYFCIFSVNLQ